MLETFKQSINSLSKVEDTKADEERLSDMLKCSKLEMKA
jgi:hypothetical protein